MIAAFAGKAFATPASTDTLRAALKSALDTYLAKRGTPEHISVVSLAVDLHRQSPFQVVAGTTLYHGTVAATPASLFQIASNTKSFTAALILRLEADGKLSITDTVGKWLPQYPQWKPITIRQLLNMTSGIVTYDDTQPMERYWAAHPYKYFSPKDLIAWVTSLRRKKGYYYSNTAYQMCDLIIEKATGHSYTANLESLIKTAGLNETYFDKNIYPKDIQDREVAGYFTNNSENNRGLFPFLGQDMRPYSLSWGQAAGGIVSTPRDLALWVRDLYTGPLLANAQRAELKTLISMKTGQPLKIPTPSDQGGYGLGIERSLFEPLGTVWLYQGVSLGYRTAWVYLPKYDAVYVVSLNSQPREDAVVPLLQTIFKTLKEHAAL
jgi:D-alanyl-D-alanine carboxypeptidase